jgi:hypothetical protein
MTPCELLLAIMLSEDPDSGWSPVWFVRPQHMDVARDEISYEVKDTNASVP